SGTCRWRPGQTAPTWTQPEGERPPVSGGRGFQCRKGARFISGVAVSLATIGHSRTWNGTCCPVRPHQLEWGALMDAILLARIQFGFTISFHIVFPAITIGLASYLAVLEALWLATGRSVYMTLYRFWLRPFAVAFAMGVVSGIVMAYQFGTHWSGFSRFAGAITGPLLTYEVLTAFFLEAGFLGVMLFGLKRVGPGLHFLSTCVVALGTLVSATWILASISWMQTPQGHEIVNGVAVPVDWLRVIFNPSFPFRLSHMVTGAFLATALIVGGTGAWHLLRRPGNAPARSMLSMAMWMLLGTAPAQA